MSTTLIEELEDAIEDTEDAANRECYTLQGRDEVNARAASLRQRIALVRELAPMEFTSRGDAELWHRLTGPIPSPGTCAGCLPADGDYGDGPPPMVLGRHVEGCNGTATTERKET